MKVTLHKDLSFHSPLELNRFVGKKVEYVSESRCPQGSIHTLHSFGYSIPYVSWRGVTEDQYFSIIFMLGSLTISLADREMDIGKDGILFAVSDRMEGPTFDSSMADIAKSERAQTYMTEYSKEELKNITFADVMEVLDWEFVHERIEVQEEFEL